MKTKTIFFVIFVLVFAGMVIYGYFKAVPAVKEEESRPKIEISPSIFDFGQADYGQVLEYTFKLKNSGSQPLEIKKVATSCACTSAEIEKELINPDEEINLYVEYNTGLMTGSHAKGEQERIIYIKSNDPINPQTEVMIYANVK